MRWILDDFNDIANWCTNEAERWRKISHQHYKKLGKEYIYFLFSEHFLDSFQPFLWIIFDSNGKCIQTLGKRLFWSALYAHWRFHFHAFAPFLFIAMDDIQYHKTFEWTTQSFADYWLFFMLIQHSNNFSYRPIELISRSCDRRFDAYYLKSIDFRTGLCRGKSLLLSFLSNVYFKWSQFRCCSIFTSNIVHYLSNTFLIHEC